jgi:hypothetical protein
MCRTIPKRASFKVRASVPLQHTSTTRHAASLTNLLPPPVGFAGLSCPINSTTLRRVNLDSPTLSPPTSNSIMIRDFESWKNLVEASQLEELRGTRVGIEAADYLRQRILVHTTNKEPLVPALGGLPLGFASHIKDDLNKFAAFDITPFFVFSGLDIAKQDNLVQQRREGAANIATAWSSYDSHFADQAVHQFGESGKIKLQQKLKLHVGADNV